MTESPGTHLIARCVDVPHHAKLSNSTSVGHHASQSPDC